MLHVATCPFGWRVNSTCASVLHWMPLSCGWQVRGAPVLCRAGADQRAEGGQHLVHRPPEFYLRAYRLLREHNPTAYFVIQGRIFARRDGSGTRSRPVSGGGARAGFNPVHCTLYAVHCTLCTAHCSTVHCTVHTVPPAVTVSCTSEWTARAGLKSADTLPPAVTVAGTSGSPLAFLHVCEAPPHPPSLFFSSFSLFFCTGARVHDTSCYERALVPSAPTTPEFHGQPLAFDLAVPGEAEGWESLAIIGGGHQARSFLVRTAGPGGECWREGEAAGEWKGAWWCCLASSALDLGAAAHPPHLCVGSGPWALTPSHVSNVRKGMRFRVRVGGVRVQASGPWRCCATRSDDADGALRARPVGRRTSPPLPGTLLLVPETRPRLGPLGLQRERRQGLAQDSLVVLEWAARRSSRRVGERGGVPGAHRGGVEGEEEEASEREGGASEVGEGEEGGGRRRRKRKEAGGEWRGGEGRGAGRGKERGRLRWKGRETEVEAEGETEVEGEESEEEGRECGAEGQEVSEEEGGARRGA